MYDISYTECDKKLNLADHSFDSSPFKSNGKLLKAIISGGEKILLSYV
jgi:hypothetical protein